MKSRTILVMVAVLSAFTVLLFSQTEVQATIINFNEGFVHRSSAQSAYNDLGLDLPLMEFFNSSLPNHLPFFYGSDDWGITINGGANPHQATMNFLEPVRYVEIDVRAQAAFDLNGSEPFQIDMVAFDPHGTPVASSSVYFGLDIVVPRAPEDGGDYPLGAVSFLLEGVGPISSVILTPGRKMGIDTLQYEQIPEPATLLLLGLGAVMLRRRR